MCSMRLYVEETWALRGEIRAGPMVTVRFTLPLASDHGGFVRSGAAVHPCSSTTNHSANLDMKVLGKGNLLEKYN